jgi:hypothetical protein
MTGKRHRRQGGWSRLPDGSVRHESGLTFLLVDSNDPDALESDLLVDQSSVAAFEAYERARGVPQHDLWQRAARLAREAGEWHQLNRN